MRSPEPIQFLLMSLLVVAVPAVSAGSAGSAKATSTGGSAKPASGGGSSKSVSSDPFKRGSELAIKKYPDEAAAEFKKITDFNALTANQLRLVTITYFDAGELADCLKMITYSLSQERVTRDKEESAWMMDLRASVYADQNKFDDAIQWYKTASQTNPRLHSEYLFKAGKVYFREKMYKEALPLLKEGIKPDRMNAVEHQDVGHCYLELHQPAQAIQPLTEAIREYVAYRTKNKTEAFLPGLVTSHKYLIQAYKETSNKEQVAIWQERYNRLVGDLNSDFFGK